METIKPKPRILRHYASDPEGIDRIGSAEYDKSKQCASAIEQNIVFPKSEKGKGESPQPSSNAFSTRRIRRDGVKSASLAPSLSLERFQAGAYSKDRGRPIDETTSQFTAYTTYKKDAERNATEAAAVHRAKSESAPIRHTLETVVGNVPCVAPTKTRQDGELKQSLKAHVSPLGFKRNSRICGNAPPSEAEKSRELTSATLCPYCGGRDPGLGNLGYLRRHVAESCPLLTKCDYCDRIVEVSDLNEHQLNRCPFVNKALGMCKACGLARYPGDESHPRCPGAFPPNDGAWCPLCSQLVDSSLSKAAWKQHALTECYSNLRGRDWPVVNSDDKDRRGQWLLESLKRDRTRLSRIAELGLSQSRRSKGLSSDQMKQALRQLNRERRLLYSRSRGFVTHRRSADESESDEH